MTLVSLATPAWKEFHNNTSVYQSASNVKDYKQAMGLFTGPCGKDNDWNACKDYFKVSIHSFIFREILLKVLAYI